LLQIALAEKTARLVAYAVFQNKYICHYINKITLKMMPDVVGADASVRPLKKYKFQYNFIKTLFINRKEIKE